MSCPGCGGVNRDGAKFCTHCGATLLLHCPSCNAEITGGGRFCDECGGPLALESEAQPVAAARKTVTVLFADLVGSTAMEERMDAEPARTLIDRIYAALRKDVEEYGGRVVKFTGDGLMAAFGVPEIHEDDATRAVECAFAMCQTMEVLVRTIHHADDLALKVGVNTGEVVVIEDDDDVVGDSVNVASRLEGAASGGEVLVGETTWKLTRSTATFEPIEPLVLKGKSEPVPTYRLLSVSSELGEQSVASFVGRDAEVSSLTAVFDDVVTTNAVRLVTIVGSPGVGKTRLANEFTTSVEDRTSFIEIRCHPMAAGSLAPVASALRTAAGIDDTTDAQTVTAAIQELMSEAEPERERIAALVTTILGIGSPASTEESFWALRRLAECVAQNAPLVIVLEDLHWAEPLLLDLVEHLAEWIRDAPVLLIVTGRPELRELRPAFTEGRLPAGVVALEGLDVDATERLTSELLGAVDVPGGLLERLPRATDGNPLFVRELVRMLVEDRVLERTVDGWAITVDVDAIVVPPTIQSLLAARVDRLSAEERAVLEAASVIGKEFYVGAVAELVPSAVAPNLEQLLEGLRRKELVEPTGTYWMDEPVYRFHHALIRDAAYRRVLKETRAELHEHIAGWFDDRTDGSPTEYDEVVAYHFEQAYGYRRELGRVDEHATSLGTAAAERLGSAARRALDRDDLPGAAALAARALELPIDDSERARTLLVQCEALLGIGDATAGASALAALEEIAGDPRLTHWATCFAGQLAILNEPERLRETEKRVAAAAWELAELGDHAGAAKAHTVHASTLERLGRIGECDAALDRALNAAREADDRRRITAVLDAAPLAALWGPNPVSRAGGRCLDIVRLLRITTGSPSVEATSDRCQALLEAFRGRGDAARSLLARAQRRQTELGLELGLLESELFAGLISSIERNNTEAIAHLDVAYEGFRARGADSAAAQAAAFLAQAHLRMGDDRAADGFARTSEELAGQDLQAAIAWRCVRAELLAHAGEFTDAVTTAEYAVEIASKTDSPIYHGHACRALAAVHRLAGDKGASRAAEEQARSLYERKGATALLEPDATVSAPEVERQDEVEGDLTADADTAIPQIRFASPGIDAGLRLVEAFERQDWDGLGSQLAPKVLYEDLRSGLGNATFGREAQIENWTAIYELGVRRIVPDVLATRGARLVLWHLEFVGSRDNSTAFLAVTEIDEVGLITRAVQLDEDAIDRAYEILDARYIAGEAVDSPEVVRVAREVLTAWNAKDWDRWRGFFDESIRFEDHRASAHAEYSTLDDALELAKALTTVIPDVRHDVVAFHALAPHVGLSEWISRGTNSEGGLVENRYLHVGVTHGGRMTLADRFDIEQHDDALVRFHELESEPPVAEEIAIPEPDAPDDRWRAMITTWTEAFGEKDWEAIAALYAPDVVREDRRSGLGVTTTGVDAVIEAAKLLVELEVTDVTEELIEAADDRVGLFRATFTRDDGHAIESIHLFELDDEGRVTANVVFNADHVDDARRELVERSERPATTIVADNDAVRVARRAVELRDAKDWDGLFEMLADEITVEDRRSGLSIVKRGHFEVLEMLRAVANVGPSELDFSVVATKGSRLELDRRVYRIAEDDGPDPFVVETLNVIEVDDEGRWGRGFVFDPDDMDAALAELEARAAALGEI